jgi:RNA polymerase sigma factor (TIGR02999 family)
VWVPDAGTRALVFEDAGCLILEPIGGPRMPGPMVFSEESPDVTGLLAAIEQGDPHAAEQLLPLVYDELRRLAALKLAREPSGLTLQPTALVHEAYLRLVGGGPPNGWDGRGHFFTAAAEAMRRILIERARRVQRIRHGGLLHRVELRDEEQPTSQDGQILALDEALTKLAGIHPQAAQLVQLRFFAGVTVDEAARMIGISPRTARRLGNFSRAWLRCEMDSSSD